MRSSQVLVGILAMLPLLGCAGIAQPTSGELAAADYGPEISKEAAESLAKQVLDTHLKDPYSAVLKCDEPTQGWRNDDVFNKYKKHYGYVLACRVNAKNSFGAYGGYKKYEFVINNGVVISAYAEAQIQTTTYMEKIK